MHQTVLSLGMVQWLAVIAGILLVLVLLQLFGGRGRSNRVTVKGDKNKVVVDQSDRSVHQTQINPSIVVHAPATPAAAHPNRRNDISEFFQMAAIGVLALFTPLYVRFFELFAVATQLLYLLATGASFTLLLLAASMQIGRPLQVAARAAFLLLVSGAGAWFLIDAQNLLDRRVMVWTQSLPMQGASIEMFFEGVWHAGLIVPTMVSAVICFFCAFVCFSVLRQLYRVAFAGFFDADGQREQAGVYVMPMWTALMTSAGLLLLMAMLRFYVMPNAAGMSLLK
jgi:hypothetical protein